MKGEHIDQYGIWIIILALYLFLVVCVMKYAREFLKGLEL